ncbi:ABC transporter permease [Terrilactibacillus laevilacticus]|uniref:ABC transporter permease n=1 Tax=Terrilactibacillus laevilacticus TaxID=1380157 RepID=A0ABW5PLM6_9BACI|nr:ABC transporter permease [Terrilactibacillus laevilacticus]
MGKYILKRLFSLIPIIIGISIIVFLIIHLVPGDPASIILGNNATPEAIKALNAKLGLDKPLIVQYFDWVVHLIQGNFGTSVQTDQSVLPTLINKFLVTFQLTLLSVLIGWIIAIPLGILSAVKANSVVDFILRIISMLGISIPNFAIGTLLLLILSVYFGWYPPIDYVNFWDDPISALKIFILPAITMGIVLSAGIMRMTRTSFIETLNKDFIRTARAKGNPEGTVIVGHGLRNSMIPIITIGGMQIGYLLGGAVIVEQLFSIPGIGQYILNGIYHRDFPVVQGGVLFISLIFVFVNLIVDIIYCWIDPRIKY